MPYAKRVVMSLADARSLHHRFTVLRKRSKVGPLSADQKALLSEAVQVIRQHSKKNPSRRKPSLDDAVKMRLSEIADIAESGVTEMTGKLKREGRRSQFETGGEVTGRFGGMKPAYPELNRLRAGPKEIAKSIRRGKGKAYRNVVSVVRDAMEQAGFKNRAKRKRGILRVSPHEGTSRCEHCDNLHTTSEHRFHGPGSFHKTHLWSFGKRNPREKLGTVIYGRVLMIQAQKTGAHRCDAECKRCNHSYYHEFQSHAVMYGLPNGDLLIRSKK